MVLKIAQAVFNPDEARVSLERTGVYRAAANVFSLDFMYSVCPTVPLSLQRVQTWANQAFLDGPIHLRDCTVVMVMTPQEDIQSLCGRWKQVTPEELTHGFIMKLAERLSAKGHNSATEDEINKWRSVALSWPMQFEVIQGEDALYWPLGFNVHFPKDCF